MTERVELTEQMPLKSDMDVNEPIIAEGGDIEAGKIDTTNPTEKKKFFWKKNKKTTTEVVSEKPPLSSEIPEATENGKKKCWWNRRCEKTEKEAQPSFGLDMIHRDEKSLHTSIDLGFTDIFGEPDAVRSFGGVWRVTNSVFNWIRNFFYKLFTLILAIPAAIVFGILFAAASTLNVFVCVPFGRLIQIPAGWIFKTWNFVISNVFDPITRSLGLLFSNISMRRYGMNNDVTQPLSA